MEDPAQLIQAIRKKVFAEAEQKFADETFQHLRCAKNNSRMSGADARSCITSSCGSSMEFYLKFSEGRVERASYVTDGENSARLCGATAADLAVGKTCVEILKLTSTDILKRAGRKDMRDERCAAFALSALHKAVRQFIVITKGASHEVQSTRNSRFLPVSTVSSLGSTN